MKVWVTLLLALAAGLPPSPAHAADWVNLIRSGQTVQVTFDAAPGKFQDQGGAGSPMGTLKGGESYQVTYSPQGWNVSGFNQGTGGVGAWIYSQGRPDDHDLNLWGRLFKFSDNGEVFDLQYGLVGHLVFAPATLPPLPHDPVPATRLETIQWTTTAGAYANRRGQRIGFYCPPGGRASDRLWGTFVYTEDTSICTAAVHAGRITFASGGAITVEIQSGANAYTGSTRNGLSSKDYGPWQGSFSFADASPIPSVPQDAGLLQGGSDWSHTATAHRGRNGQQLAYHCPANGHFGSIWGTDLYTDDSSVCTAAVHAGILSQRHGGTVVIEIRPGASAYKGTARNGVSTGNYGHWSGSFVLTGAR